MTRLNLILFFALIFSSLGLVNAQHRARKQYIELEQISQDAKQYEQEYGQLQLEQSTWAMHSRVELIASQQLQMQVPDSKRVQVVVPQTALPAKTNSALQPVSDTQSTTAITDISVKVGVQDNEKERPESQVEQAYRIDTLNRKQNLPSSANKATVNKNVPPKTPSRLTLAPAAEVKP